MFFARLFDRTWDAWGLAGGFSWAGACEALPATADPSLAGGSMGACSLLGLGGPGKTARFWLGGDTDATGCTGGPWVLKGGGWCPSGPFGGPVADCRHPGMFGGGIWCG